MGMTVYPWPRANRQCHESAGFIAATAENRQSGRVPLGAPVSVDEGRQRSEELLRQLFCE